MKFKADPLFFEQARRHALAFTCEQCAIFDPKSGACIHGYPNEVHRDAYNASSPDWIIPCKDFELQ